MKNIPKILVKTYLRRQPVHLRLSRFNYLSRYGWLQNLLADLRPEFFSDSDLVEETIEEPVGKESEDFLLPTIGREIQGQQGRYKVHGYLMKRGNGHLFQGVRVSSKQPVVVKEYLLPTQLFRSDELHQISRAFLDFAGFRYLDERERDIRIIQPLEAIADSGDLGEDDVTHRRFYLITPEQDAASSLALKIREQYFFSTSRIRTVLAQILQTLSVLHQQKVLLPSGEMRLGLVHGNLQIENTLCIEENGHLFIYLSDLLLWEQVTKDPAEALLQSTVEPRTVARDLSAVGQIGHHLIEARALSQYHALVQELEDPFLDGFIRQLSNPDSIPFESADAAWQALLALPVPLSDSLSSSSLSQAQPKKKRRLSRRALLGIGAALAVLGGLVLLLGPIARGRAEDGEDAVDASVCCLAEVSAIPVEPFNYAAVRGGLWESILQRQDLGQRGQSLSSAIAPLLSNSLEDSDILKLVTDPAEAIAQIQSGEADFAVLSLTSAFELPIELGVQTIAYDGLAAVVPFSYARREKGLPSALDGTLPVEALRDIYLGSVDDWREVGGPRGLETSVYLADNPDIVAIFEQQILYPATLADISEPGSLLGAFRLPTLEMLRTIIRDFELRQVGSLGIAPLSQIMGQCSVYPLAISEDNQTAVQPWEIVRTGKAIQPTTNLCDRKGLYQPDISAFKSGNYPLTYSLAVVYPQDNSRSPIGQKLAELLTTDEGQRLLSEAGFVPIREIATP
ncbi:hypothetical protein [cf. Phormidesmis sp. LEGE 11477]|uniref:hypothetical protein n=1 Tax=cf. Phormidesmis sp. LEGE 11477 TaxID=1828680 RepID=UPI00188271D2|nr:hypothetical protein [cf. Phormidesmis sp. LEGE 11477]MBE9062987.1 hypothetical protein [cf. Phormidesmis sp. LEGE 11477]